LREAGGTIAEAMIRLYLYLYPALFRTGPALAPTATSRRSDRFTGASLVFI
jgi:hypothetical protein